MTDATGNPLLADRDTPFGLPPFDRITDAAMEEAIEAALAQSKADIEAIATAETEPSFAGVIDALERAGRPLSDALSVFFTYTSVASTPEREAMQRRISPRLAAHSSDILLNPDLFAKIDALWQARETLGLDAEQARVLELTHRNFVRAGAALDAEGRARLREIATRLADLSTAFGQNLLADERDWTLPLSEADLAGLPDFVIESARAAGAERGLERPVITLSRSLIVPFLQFCPRRDLRERAYEAWASRGVRGGATDNRAIVAETLALRHERARLLGYDSFSEHRLAVEMAKTPDAVRELLDTVWAPARAQALADGARLTAMLEAEGEAGPLRPWDWRYYAEKRREAEHALDEAALKPHFPLERMRAAAFDCAHRLFGLEFRPVEDVVLHHPDARAWEVTRAGRHLALLVADDFARAGKRSGAWCSTLRAQGKLDGERRAIVLNVCNFARPPEGRPALLSHDDARTLFHEFGHALHHILSDVTYASISGTSVARDFVELPSQLFEHWLDLPEVLERFALHVETGAPLPRETRDSLRAAASFDMGFQTVEFIASARVDLELHAGPPPADQMQKQAEVLAEIGMPAAIGMRHAVPHFAHIFSGGYASSYYSYMWSEVMDADAFAAFEETGDPFDAATAAALERHVLSAGGSAEPETLYAAFRGRMPTVDALLRGRGLASAPETAQTAGE